MWKTKQKAFLQSNGSTTIKIIDRFQLKRISPHGLRHTVATLLSQSGIPIKQIQMQLGD
ncbi:tyrosine-type recombinase/integrase [Lentilactobacillus otakiensis]|uniref:tyrosine-type recombinase/integrase n=1 Tax=Lentilactobacillus otakiensis TaxID=481720 RepID=UPI0009DC025C